MKRLVFNVRGVTFGGRQELIDMLEGDEPVKLIPEPQNVHDPNALAVWIPVQGIPAHLGFVPKELAAQIAASLEGESLLAKIDEITGGFDISPVEQANLGLRIAVEIPVPF